MKLSSLPLVLALVAAPSLAQEAAPALTPPPAAVAEVVRNKSIIVQPIPWAFGAYGGTFEIALQERLSLVMGLNLAAFTLTTNTSSGSSSSSSSTSILGGGIQPGIAWYLVGKAPAGLWVSPKLELGYIALTTGSSFSGGGVSTSSTTTSGFVYGAHVMIGYTHVTEIGLTFQLGVGVGFTGGSISSSFSGGGTSGTPVGVLGSFGRLSLGVGWSF